MKGPWAVVAIGAADLVRVPQSVEHARRYIDPPRRNAQPAVDGGVVQHQPVIGLRLATGHKRPF
jgi:hypothetical protein